MDLQATHIKYIESTLVPQILQQNECFGGQELVDSIITISDGLDGFMSAIYQLELKTRNIKDNEVTITKIIIKLMKGTEEFRVGSKAYTQFGNEIYYYTNIQPSYEELIASSKSDIKFEDITPKAYYGFFGKVPELGDLRESVLAVQDLRPQHFRGGPRLVLDEAHLRLMIGQIAKFHALSYGLKIKNPTRYDEIVSGIVEMKFLPSGEPGDTTNLFMVLYDIALTRFLAYIKRTQERRSAKFLADVDNLERKYGNRPVALLEHLRRDDGVFSVIQHGDYNRNNVLFRYADRESFDKPEDVRMFDFQELRFGSPVFDLAFFMYMNSDPENRPNLWEGLLAYYHETMFTSLAGILGCDRNDDILKPYDYENFRKHFAKFAFYGVMVCLHFTPWMICPEAHCDRLSKLFETDMYGKAFYEVSMIVGGDEADERMTEVVEHASRMGYMKWLED